MLETRYLNHRSIRPFLFAVVSFLTLGYAPASATETFEDGLRALEAGDVAGARAVWMPLAEAGDARSQFGLGRLWARQSVKSRESEAEAIAWYGRAAQQGSSKAQNNRAVLLRESLWTQHDPQMSLNLWRQAANGNDVIAQYNLGVARLRGDGVSRDPAVSLGWFHKAAEQGLVQAQHALSEMYRHGIGAPKDEEAARHWRMLAGAAHSQSAHPNQSTKPARPSEEAHVAAGGQPAVATATASDLQDAPPSNGEQRARGMERGGDAAEEGQSGASAVSANDGEAQAAGRPQKRDLHSIWIGSMRSLKGATRLWNEMSEQFPSVLTGLQPLIWKVDVAGRGTFFRILAGAWEQRSTAVGHCMQINRGDAGGEVSCLVVRTPKVRSSKQS